MSDTIEINNKNLDKLIKLLKNNPPTVRVGIIGGTKNTRSEAEGQTNAEVGASHEFGTDKLPRRSFLRMPLTEKLNSYLEKSNAFDEKVMNDVIKDGSILGWMKKVAITAESVIQEAFNTGGFGKWKPSNMNLKETKQTLVETQQLRNNITSEVK